MGWWDIFGAFAQGGVVEPKPYLVGENPPEHIVLTNPCGDGVDWIKQRYEGVDLAKAGSDETYIYHVELQPNGEHKTVRVERIDGKKRRYVNGRLIHDHGAVVVDGQAKEITP